MTISVPDELALELQQEARRRHASVSEIVRGAVERHVLSCEAPGLPFAAVGRSGKKHTARDAEAILAREWGGARRR